LRGPAPQAQSLYIETEESTQQRQAIAAQLQLQRPAEFSTPGRPTREIAGPFRDLLSIVGSFGPCTEPP
jgi:hypothetical protein